jgi:NAD(P)-dependent dehydrogenase (short-subunit alcohol dehydrogenase family)
MFKASSTEELEGKTVLVTGGSRGIGFATARAFLEAGSRVAICALDTARLAGAEASLRGLGHVAAARVDVRDPQAVRRYIQALDNSLGGVDILINNAGITHVGRFAVQPYESIDAVIDVNLKGVMYTTRAVLPGMIERGGGVIVNVASGAGLAGFPDLVGYCSAKFGVVGFTESLDQEVRAQGVRVHAVCPGRVATDMQVQYSGAKIGLAPETVAARILELAGPRPRAEPGRCVTLG